MKRLFFVACAIAFGLASCSRVPAEVENVVAYTRVGDINNVMVDAIEITVSNPRSLWGLKAEDFDLINNMPDGFVDPATGQAPVPYEDDGIVLTRTKNTLRIEANSFNYRGRRGQNRQMEGWQLVCHRWCSGYGVDRLDTLLCGYDGAIEQVREIAFAWAIDGGKCGGTTLGE